MLISFVRHGTAFLPEVEAYIKFFTAMGVKCEDVVPAQLARTPHDVEWHIMGIDSTSSPSGICKIHDYASASMPPVRWAKDLLKKWINTRPDYRIFLNEYVQRQFAFRDDVPFGFRDMGIEPGLALCETRKEYDFIYVGEVSAARGFEKWANVFTHGGLKGKSLLVVSKGYQGAASKLAPYRHIQFVGPVSRTEVGRLIGKARFALNLVPDKEPFNSQTSTKLLEYAAAAVPIITTDYRWVREFETKHGGRFFYVTPDLSNLNWDLINSFDYEFPDLRELNWDEQIRRSGIVDFLASRFPRAFQA